MRFLSITVASLLFTFSVASAEVRGVFHTAGEVFSTLSPTIEEEFDAFVIANTMTKGSANDLIPFQHARYIVKKKPQNKVFQRNAQGQITGIIESNVTTVNGLPKFIPVSSGKKGDGGILTFSGIFRVNEKKSRSPSTSKEADMSYAMYIDAIYPSGKSSGVAIHGTPTKNHGLLGKYRASHGCLRTFPAYAKLIHAHAMSSANMQAEDVPVINQKTNLPGEKAQNGELGFRKGTRTLFVMFNGY